jgi:hypothetical protein
MKTLDGLTIYEAQDEIRKYLSPLYASKPKHPLLLGNKPTAEEMKIYSEALLVYEKELQEYETKDDFYRTESGRLWSLLEDKVKEDSGLNDIPEQYRSKVYSYAYELGHSSGYGEVYNYLCNLVNIFE